MFSRRRTLSCGYIHSYLILGVELVICASLQSLINLCNRKLGKIVIIYNHKPKETLQETPSCYFHGLSLFDLFSFISGWSHVSRAATFILSLIHSMWYKKNVRKSYFHSETKAYAVECLCYYWNATDRWFDHTKTLGFTLAAKSFSSRRTLKSTEEFTCNFWKFGTWKFNKWFLPECKLCLLAFGLRLRNTLSLWTTFKSAPDPTNFYIFIFL